jgi:hypothetical protein
MTVTMKQLMRRHGAFVSGITGIALVVVLIGQEMAQTVTFLFSAEVLPDFYLGSFAYSLTRAVPFGIGFFLSLWLVAPIAEELRVPHVITRAILATGIACTVTFIVAVALAVIDSFDPGRSLFANAFPFSGFDGDGAVQGMLRALTAAVTMFIEEIPLGVLAGILLWIWRKDHRPKRPLEGIIDL